LRGPSGVDGYLVYHLPAGRPSSVRLDGQPLPESRGGAPTTREWFAYDPATRLLTLHYQHSGLATAAAPGAPHPTRILDIVP
jgi:hypothetical protein